MDISALLRIITEKGSYLAGAALTMFIVLGLTGLGLLRLPETWLHFIIVAGTFSAMVLLSGAVASGWPKLVCWIQCRRQRKRREEYSIKNFEDLGRSHHHYHALVFIKDRGKQRFQWASSNSTLREMVEAGLLDTDNLERGSLTHYVVPQRLWDRMQEGEWGTDIEVSYQEPWIDRI